MSRIFTVPRILVVVLAAASIGGSSSAGSAVAQPAGTPKPIVTILEHGGLCRRGECRTLYRITDTRVTAPGFRPRRLTVTERAALLHAIRLLDSDYFRAHPFRGTCPTSLDLTERVYRFRGYSRPLASCRYDLRAVRAVQLTDRLLERLEPR